ncbi:MAG TPA: hypothetical protein VGC41_20635 [Kofleriaceae bacterium]
MPVWLMMMLGLAGALGLGGLLMTVIGMNSRPEKRRTFLLAGVAMSVLGAAAFLIMLGTA